MPGEVPDPLLGREISSAAGSTDDGSLGEPPHEPPGALTTILQALLVALVLATFTTTFLFKAFRIPTASMDQTLQVGDQVLVNLFVFGSRAGGWERALLPKRSVRRGDVVVFRFPQDPRRDFIKRCVGLPFDRIQIIDKELFVNGLPVDESAYIRFADERIYRSRFVDAWLRTRDNFGPYTVPAGHYFCLGDNRDRSRDSRFWGVVPEGLIKGRAFLIYWSFDLAAPPDVLPEVSEGLESDPVARNAPTEGSRWLRPLTATRWHRVFRLVR